MPGQVRVGRSRYEKGRVFNPKFPGFKAVPVLTTGQGKYGDISPYNLQTLDGKNIENHYQFSKVYRDIPQVSIPYSSKDPRIVWNWSAETHIDVNGNLTPQYWRWREAGKNNPHPVRNPVGWNHLKNCQFSLAKDEPISETNPRLNYIEARTQIYVPVYLEAALQHPLFIELWGRLQRGENLLLIDVDGPHQESLEYYRGKYRVSENFIENHSILATSENLNILLNDPKHPFGHCFALAHALQHYQPIQLTQAEFVQRIQQGILVSGDDHPEFQSLVSPGHRLISAKAPNGRVCWIDLAP